jgi:RNA polymerase sigma factor (sigma-70 family)
MQEVADRELLRQYVHGDSHEAFEALLERHVNLVYSVGLRKTGSPQAAEEITQAVFIILARKARKLSEKTVLPGWLYHTARLTAVNFIRGEMRRARREQEAYTQALGEETEPAVWPQIAPLVEDAMGQLGKKDRDAIVLRFFEGKSFREIAGAAGASENAAKKRVHYALEKLRRYFAKRGVVSTASSVAGAMSAYSAHAAPAALVKTVTAVAVGKGALVGGSTLALVKATLKSLLWGKVKSAAGVSAGALALGAALTIAVTSTNLLSSGRGHFQFSAQGVCRLIAFNSTGNETTDYPFTVTVSNQLWFMRITDVRSNAVAGYFEIGGDGQRTYYVDYQESWAQTAALRRGTGNAENVAVGIIGPQEVPHFPFAPQAGAIWLAYASGHYFDVARSPRIQPAASLFVLYGRNVQPNSFALQEAHWSRTDQSPGVPASVVYLDDGIAGIRNGVPVKWPSPLDLGFTNAAYQALEYTNAGSLTLPTRAVLNTFGPQLGPPGARVVPRVSYQVVATNVSLRPLYAGNFKPRLPGKTFVNDMRFSAPAHDLHVNYYASDERWLADDEVKQLPEYAVAVGQASQRRDLVKQPARLSRPVVWVVFGLLSAWPVILFYRQRRRGGL